MTPEILARHFASAAAHWTLDPTIAFLNHGSYGATPRVVQEEQRYWRDRMERQPVRFHKYDVEGLEREAMRVLARFVNAPPDDMAWVVNATEGTNCVLQSFPLAAGDEILSTDHAYPAVEKTMRHVAARVGAKLVLAAVPYPVASASDIVEAVIARITPRTKLIVIDHITSMTATIFPVKEIVARSHALGVPVLVDGAHAPGMLDLSVSDIGADFYTGNCHKWCCSPKGAGFLHVHPRHQDHVQPVSISHGHENPRTDMSPFVSRFSIQGTRDTSAMLSVPKALEFMNGLGWAEVRSWGHHLARRFRLGLAAELGVTPPVPDSPDWYGMTATMPLPLGEEEPFKSLLTDRHHVELPIIIWRGARWCRISGMPYNTEEQVDAAVRAIERVARDGQCRERA